jgi:hypothetical protein
MDDHTREFTKGKLMIKQIRVRFQALLWMSIVLLLAGVPVWAKQGPAGSHTYRVQLPYEPPPQPEYPPGKKATPAPETLTPQDQERLESLIPLLEGRQEFWAMGEFVHYGKHSVPYLVEALKMPGSRVRFNAVETLSMIDDPSGIPGLLDVAMNSNEEPRIRSHALRVATRLDPNQVLPALEVMVKDPNSTIRNTAVFESRYVHRKEVLPIIISAIPDPEQYVSITARDTFWILTRFSGAIHDWEASTPEDRKEWVKEWWAWWEEHKDQLDGTLPSTEPPSPPANLNVS